MEVAIIVIFVIGYLAIALEHPIKINKTASALLTGVLCWTLFVLSEPSTSVTESESYTSFLQILKIELGERTLPRLGMTGYGDPNPIQSRN